MFRSRFHSLFDLVYLSQFQVGCINEDAAAAAAELVKQQSEAASAAVSSEQVVETKKEEAKKTDSSTPVEELPLNKMLKPQANILIETVKSETTQRDTQMNKQQERRCDCRIESYCFADLLFGFFSALFFICPCFFSSFVPFVCSCCLFFRFLPVPLDVKSAYVSRVTDLALSAGWSAVPELPATAWSPEYFHSWSEREIEQPTEQQEKKEAEEAPARINFTYAPKKK